MRTTTILFVLAACGTDPVNYSAPVGIELHVVTEQKDITTEFVQSMSERSCSHRHSARP